MLAQVEKGLTPLKDGCMNNRNNWQNMADDKEPEGSPTAGKYGNNWEGIRAWISWFKAKMNKRGTYNAKFGSITFALTCTFNFTRLCTEAFVCLHFSNF